MSGRVFIDTNVFIYMYADNEPEKQQLSIKVIDNADHCITSTQVLNEISNVMQRKWKLPFEAIRQVQKDIRQICEVVQVSEHTINLALDLCERYGYSYYDCLVLSSAVENDCDIIYTEDLSDGQNIFDKTKIVNPFEM